MERLAGLRSGVGPVSQVKPVLYGKVPRQEPLVGPLFVSLSFSICVGTSKLTPASPPPGLHEAARPDNGLGMIDVVLARGRRVCRDRGSVPDIWRCVRLAGEEAIKG